MQAEYYHLRRCAPVPKRPILTFRRYLSQEPREVRRSLLWPIAPIKSFWATLRRAYYGVHHWWSRMHAQRYADGAAFRVNVREFDGPARVAVLVEAGAQAESKL